jgi:hypothetical protein
MSTASKLNAFYTKLQNKYATLEANKQMETLLFYLRHIDDAIKLLSQYDDAVVDEILEIMNSKRAELVAFTTKSDLMMMQGSEEDYIDSFRENIKVWTNKLLEANKDRAAYKKQFQEHLDEQRNSTYVKMEWLLSSFEIETKQNLQNFEMDTLLSDAEELSLYLSGKVYRLKNLKQEMMKIERNIRKSFERFFSTYKLHLDTLDITHFIRFDTLVDQKMILEDQEKLDQLAKGFHSKGGLFGNFTKKKRLKDLSISIEELLDNRIASIKGKMHETLEEVFDIPTNLFDESLHGDFKGEFCDVNELNAIVRVVNDLDQNLIMKEIKYTIKELIRYG